MGKLTTHVLDTAHGQPARGMRIELYRLEDGVRRRIGEHRSNADGRCDAALLDAATLTVGCYELDFHVGDYFAALGLNLPQPRFLDVVTLRFGMADAHAHYHVPLLVSPYSYSTYRGS